MVMLNDLEAVLDQVTHDKFSFTIKGEPTGNGDGTTERTGGVWSYPDWEIAAALHAHIRERLLDWAPAVEGNAASNNLLKRADWLLRLGLNGKKALEYLLKYRPDGDRKADR